MLIFINDKTKNNKYIKITLEGGNIDYRYKVKMPIVDIIQERDLEEMNLIWCYGADLEETEKAMNKILTRINCPLPSAKIYYSIFNDFHIVYASIPRVRTHLDQYKENFEIPFEQLQTPKLECLSFDLNPEEYKIFLEKIQLGLKADEWYIQERIDQYLKEKDRKLDLSHFFFLAEYRKSHDEYRIYIATKFKGTRFK